MRYWFGSVPSGWKAIKLKFLCKQNLEKTSSKSNYVGLENIESNTSTYIASNIVPSGENIKFSKGDILFGKLRPYLAKVWRAEFDGCCSSEFFVLTAKEINPDYLKLVLISPSFIELVNGSTFGAKMPRSNWEFVGDQFIPVPPLEMQRCIAYFVAKSTLNIDALSKISQSKLELLSSYRQSLITRAVTKGLDPNVAMKNCCISRVDTIPQKWNVATLKHVCWIRARLGWKGLKAEEYTKSGYGFLSAFNIQSNKLLWENLNYISKQRYDESPEIKLSVGDVLLVKDGAGIGKTAYIDNLPIEATTNSSLAVVTPNKNLDYKYLYYYFNSTPFKSLVDEVLNGMGVPHLTQENLNNLKIPIPQIEEQKSIVEFLDNKNEKLLKIEKSIVQTINRLTEYRSSLISAAVTGQLAIDEAAE